MKIFFSIIILLLPFISQAEIGLYTSDSLFPKGVADLEAVIKNYSATYPEKNILLYVHGRSKTLEKEWNNIGEVEKIYNLKVIMLHWDSWNYMLSRPVGNAIKASKMLFETINEFDRIKKATGNTFMGHKLFLMCHSMGNITFKNYIENFDQSKLSAQLFDRVILTGADVPFTKHVKWLSKVTLSLNVDVIMNVKDSVLIASNTLDYTGLNLKDDRLGLGIGIDNFLFFNTHSFSDATYYDLTSVAGTGHRHYLSDKVQVKNLFHYLFMERGQNLEVAHSQKKNLIKLK